MTLGLIFLFGALPNFLNLWKVGENFVILKCAQLSPFNL